MGRGVFSCTGGGSASLIVWNLDTQQQEGRHGNCDGVRHHTPIVAYRNGETLKLKVDSKKTIKVEAWAGY
jgi:hypothetical protein